jgi:predicted neuraminidase
MIQRIALALVALIAFIPVFVKFAHIDAPRAFAVKEHIRNENANANEDADAPLYLEDFIPNMPDVAAVHSPAITEMRDGTLLAVWFGGTREGARDVALYASTLDPKTNEWSAAPAIVTQDETARETLRYIKRIGNPALYTDARGRTWLFYVTVSIGGWSLSQINFKTTDDGAQSWTRAKQLQLVPFFNGGTLVKGQPLVYTDGTIALPVYRDYGDLTGFPELVRLDETGEVLDKTRIAWGRRAGIQPSIVPLAARRALCFLRDTSGARRRVLLTKTDDAGASWATPAATDLPNPDSALMALRLADGTILLVFNNTTLGRGTLALARSNDEGASWRIVHTFEDETKPDVNGTPPEFSYPCLIQTRGGAIHLLYTWRRKKIKHIIFNEAWLKMQSG